MELKEILNIFEEHGFNENNCSFFRQEDITDIAKELKEAINYNRCSTELCDCVMPKIKNECAFDDVLKCEVCEKVI